MLPVVTHINATGQLKYLIIQVSNSDTELAGSINLNIIFKQCNEQ